MAKRQRGLAPVAAVIVRAGVVAVAVVVERLGRGGHVFCAASRSFFASTPGMFMASLSARAI
jgi:hypothetical protein